MQDLHLESIVAEQPYSLLFITLSGSHLYGFASPHSDYDLRGVHILPAQEVLGLSEGKQTIDFIRAYQDYEVDLSTHDLRKFLKLLLGKNGGALEALYSPRIVYTTPEHDELKAIAMRCVSRHYAYHYLGFANSQIKLFLKEQPRRVKVLLHIYRVILTGLLLLQTGQHESDMQTLYTFYKLPYLADMVARKQQGGEQGLLEEDEIPFHQAECARLLQELENSIETSVLPDRPDPQIEKEFNAFLVRLRLRTIA